MPCSKRIGSCLACVYRVMDASGKFGKHEQSVRVAEAQLRATLASCCKRIVRVILVETTHVHVFKIPIDCLPKDR